MSKSEQDKTLEEEEEAKLERIKRIDRILDADIGEDMIGKLMDVENPLERTTSPHIGFVLLQLYLRQGARYFGVEGPGKVLLDLANDLSSGMISYKDKRMEHLREILKKAPENVTVTPSSQSVEAKEKKSFFDRFKRKEDEF